MVKLSTQKYRFYNEISLMRYVTCITLELSTQIYVQMKGKYSVNTKVHISCTYFILLLFASAPTSLMSPKKYLYEFSNVEKNMSCFIPQIFWRMGANFLLQNSVYNNSQNSLLEDLLLLIIFKCSIVFF